MGLLAGLDAAISLCIAQSAQCAVAPAHADQRRIRTEVRERNEEENTLCTRGRAGGGVAAGRRAGGRGARWRRPRGWRPASGRLRDGSPVGDPVRGNAAVHRRFSAGGPALLGAPLRQDLGRVDRRGAGAVPGNVRLAADAVRGAPPDAAGVPAVHHPAAGAVHGGRRHPFRRQLQGHAAQQHRVSRRRHGDRELDRDNRRVDAADPPGDARQQGPPPQGPRHRLLHFPGQQYRRRPDAARRSSAVPGLPQGRELLLAHRARIPAHAAAVGASARPVLRHGHLSVPQGRRPRARPDRAGRPRRSQDQDRHQRMAQRGPSRRRSSPPC